MSASTNQIVSGVGNLSAGGYTSIGGVGTFQNISSLDLSGFAIGKRISTTGYYTDGDGGAAIYERVAATTHNLYATAADGSLWQIADDEPITLLKAGAKRNEDTLCDTQVTNAIDALVARGGGTLWVDPGYFYIQKLTLKSKVNVIGWGRTVSTLKARFNWSPGGDFGLIEMDSGTVTGVTVADLELRNNGSQTMHGMYFDASLAATGGLWNVRFSNLLIRHFYNGVWFRGGKTGSLQPHQWVDLDNVEIRVYLGVVGNNIRFTGQCNQFTSNNLLLSTTSGGIGGRDGACMVFDRDPTEGTTGRVPWGHVHKLTSLQSKEIGVYARGGQNIVIDTPYLENLPYGFNLDGVTPSTGLDIEIRHPRFADIGTSATYSITDGYWVTAINDATVVVTDPLNISGPSSAQRFQYTSPAYIELKGLGRSIGGQVSGLSLQNPYKLSISIPSGIAPTGSVAANGALTLGTALNTTYAADIGIYLAFPAGAVYAGSVAGSYYCEMTSTTAGTVYNNLLSGYPTRPATLVPIVAAGPGAYTGLTTEVTLVTVTVSGGLLGINGALKTDCLFAVNNNANAKTQRHKYAGVLASNGNLASGLSLHLATLFRNRGSQTVNRAFGAMSFGSISGSGISNMTIDTSVNWDLTITGQLATATDYMLLDGVDIEVVK